MTVGKMTEIGEKLLRLNLEDISINIVPGETKTLYNEKQEKNISYYSMHEQQTADLLNEKFRPYTASVSAQDLQIPELSNQDDYYDNTGNTLKNILED